MESKIYLNGYSIESNSPKDIVGIIFKSIPDLKYWSYEALKDIFQGTLELVWEWSRDIGQESKDAKKKKQAVNFSKFIKNQIRFISETRKDMLKRIYDLILNFEGLSTLHGFGISNQFGDNLKGNPERQSLRGTKI